MIALALLLLQAAPPEGWTETRFHRVHLRNGNFLDGQLVANEPEAVTLRVKSGEMEITRDLVMKVEYLRIRSYEDKPTPVPPPEPVSPEAPPTTAVFPEPPASPVRSRVEELLSRARRAPEDGKERILSELSATGFEGALLLISLLERLDDASAAFAGRALREIRNPLLRDRLKPLLRSSSPVARAEAVETLSALGVETDLLGDPSPVVRAAALRAAEFFKPRAALSRCAALCGDAHPEVRRLAVRAGFAVARAHDQGAPLVAALVELLRGSAGEAARVDILDALGRLRHADVWASVAEQLKRDEAPVRLGAARCLGELKNAEATPAMAEALEAEASGAVKIALIEAAGKIKDPAVIPALIARLSEEDPKVVRSAADALWRISGQNLGTTRARWEDYWNAIRNR